MGIAETEDSIVAVSAGIIDTYHEIFRAVDYTVRVTGADLRLTDKVEVMYFVGANVSIGEYSMV